MNYQEKTTYSQLAHEFENRLNRQLTTDEEEYLEWLAKRSVSELK